ncbi:MAG: cytochrome c-type biogenesis protein CcmH [Granulosicoccus sp.]|nr:cytochrome c-type biogenesis protein CcmH [Granulosicoccus sp.]
MTTHLLLQSVRSLRLVLLGCLSLYSFTAVAQSVSGSADPLVEFTSDAQLNLFESLTHELRCLKCQNQTIADSQAGLAGDLRRDIREQIEAGRNREEIKQYMVDRYGEFILYRPRLTLKTLFLWLGPALMLLLGLYLAWSVTRQRRSEAAKIDVAEIDKARSYLDAE